jgi:hypothetical protein
MTANTRESLSRDPCPLGGSHQLTQPIKWIGASCWKCHRTWEGTGLFPTWPDHNPASEATP